MSTRATIVSEIEKIAKEHSKSLAPLTDELPLLESGLDSLGFAILVVRLEALLNVDPFAADSELDFPVTFGDLVRIYEDAAKSAAQPASTLPLGKT